LPNMKLCNVRQSRQNQELWGQQRHRRLSQLPVQSRIHKVIGLYISLIRTISNSQIPMNFVLTLGDSQNHMKKLKLKKH
jgi:hypothetical protein